MILTDAFVAIACCECGVPFGLPQYVEKVRRQDSATFYCPMGHAQHFPRGKTEAQILREQLLDALAARDHESQQRAAAEAATRRLKQASARQAKRARAGVCPCCNRTFVAMARHMKTQHPEFGK